MIRRHRPRYTFFRPTIELLEDRCLPSTVANLLDNGPGSLRQALMDTPAGGTVDFQPGLTGTITLTMGGLVIANDLTVSGPGAGAITVSGNHASRVFVVGAGSTVGIAGLTIADGYAGTLGGGIDNAGTLTVTHCTLSGNRADGDGGGVSNSGTLIVNNCTVTSNSAGDRGSGINIAGGGLYNSPSGTLTVTGCDVSHNSVGDGDPILNSFSAGGGIANFGALTVTGSTLSSNSVFCFGSSDGGGIYNFGTLAVTGSTFNGNSTGANPSTGGAGGALFNAGTLTVTDSTVGGNSTSGTGGGIFNQGTRVLYVRNTIVAGNSGGSSPDVSGLLQSQGHNLIGNTQGDSGFEATDLLNVDPLLGPLQDNGGLTQTMALLPGSPAIYAGDITGAPATDQRGFPRILGGAIDIGAFEVQPAGQATHLGFDAPDSTPAGTPFDATVTVLDDFGEPAAGYRGTVRFTLVATAATLAYTYTAADMGHHTFSGLVLPRARLDTVTAADTASPLITGVVTLTVTPATPDHLTLVVAPVILAGTPFIVTATVQDAYGNTVTDYQGTIHFTLSGPLMQTPIYSFMAEDMGSHAFDPQLIYTAGVFTLDGTDYADVAISGTTTFTITPAAATHIAFMVPTAITAGVPFAVTVTVQDAYGNTVTGYTGTVHFTLTGPAMAVADYIFTAADMGSHTFSNLALSQVGDYTLTGVDSADPTISASTLFTVSG
jgi:hypothetical protein